MGGLAALLAQARRDARQVRDPLPPALVPPDADAAYAVNAEAATLLGWEPLGRKIAGTTEAVRARLGLAGPIYGRTFRRFALPSPARLPHAELLDPLVECEFLVTLARNLPPRDRAWTATEVLAAVEEVRAGIEVAECRFPLAALPPLPAILADGAASGRYIFGGRIDAPLDRLADIEVVLEVDGAPRRRLGGGLAAGETVSTGSCTGMLPVRAGQFVRAVFGRAAVVEVAFEA